MCTSAVVRVFRFVTVLLTALFATAQAGTVYVSTTGNDTSDGLIWATAKKTVQAGLNAATAGDQVWVAVGTYVERITLKAEVGLYGGFVGSETELGQRNWTTNVTILDGNRTGSVVTVPPGALLNTRIDGFAIRNGSGTSGGTYNYGGGIYCATASPTIANNTITGNFGGGGIYCSAASPRIVGNTIESNTPTGNGGGIHCASSSSPTIEGNIIRNNAASMGGGIYCSASTPTITGNTITGNSAGSSSAGGGICCSSSSAIITGNTIAGNKASYHGGGICCLQGSSATITNNVIRNNTATWGGGLYCESSAPTIANNTIASNAASSAASEPSGGGIQCVSSAAMIMNNRITANIAVSVGGGINCSGSPSPTLANNTINDNTATSGGAIYCHSGSPAIANNTIAGNRASSSGGGLYFAYSSSPTVVNTIVVFNSSGICAAASAVASLRFNCVYGNINANYSGLNDPTGSSGNISADPMLASIPYGNLHINAGSPCANAGDDTVIGPDWLDTDGQARITGGHVDIGADESDGTVWPEGPSVIVRVSPAGDDANDGSSWPLAKRTVQAGIDAAEAKGGEVWVQAGTYTEQVILRDYAHVYGGFAGTEDQRCQRDWTRNETILDGNHSGSVVIARRLGYGLSSIDGFAIRNGYGAKNESVYNAGGGVYCYQASPIIANNTITGNSSGMNGYGGGIYSDGGCPTITNNNIVGNTASSDGGGIHCRSGFATIKGNTIKDNRGYSGGGVYCFSSSVTIADNTITGNSAFCSCGGGIYCSSGTITGNVITGNSAYRSGGGIYCSSATVLSNTIAANSASSCGGGVYCSSGMIGNNTIKGNSAPSGGAVYCTGSATFADNTIVGNGATAGGGIYCYSSSATITNNTVASNSAPAGGGLYCIGSSPVITNTIVAFNSSGICADSALSLRCNCVYGNAGYNYSGITDPTGTNGNVSVDPKLADVAYGNLHLQPDSPCIDIGQDGVVGADWKDMDGQPRIDGSHVDIGTDESDRTAWPAGPYAVVRVTPLGDDVNDGSSWTAAKRTVQAAIDAAAAAGGEVWVQEGTYMEQIILRPHTYVYGGFAGTEIQRSARAWSVRVTVLDGNKVKDVVTATGIGCGLSAIDGFTIRNGSSAGSGIRCERSSLVITNDAISDNYNGVYCISSSPAIMNNTIANNVSGGVVCSSSKPKIANNRLVRNNGGGICCTSSSPMIVNNTIIANDGRDGAGIICGDNSSPTIANTIVAFNSSGIYVTGTGMPTLHHNCVYGNSIYNYSGVADPTGTNSNTANDPKLADAFSSAHLQAGSPCIDAGDDSVIEAEWKDIDGQDRVAGSHVDIGADESDGTVWPDNMTPVVRVSPQGDDANDGSSWAKAKRTVWAGVAAAPAGWQVWVAAGTYEGPIGLKVGVALYGGFAGNETDLTQRNWKTNVTILDGKQAGCVVRVYPGAGLTTRIDGFTLRNGTGAMLDSLGLCGGGICCQNASPTIANNTIERNSAEYGGGIFCDASSSALIVNNTIRDNTATLPAQGGGGIYCRNSSPTIANNTIRSNMASDWDGLGGGIYGIGSSLNLTNNTIAGNGAGWQGGAIYCKYTTLAVTNNTIVNNMAPSVGGIYCYTGCSGTISNTIIAFNSSVGIEAADGMSLRHSCVYGNGNDLYSYMDPSGTNGNISADPKLASASFGNLHLQPGSPCIDTGEDAAVQPEWLDIDGQNRIAGSHVDMGADESDSTVWQEGPYIIVRVSPTGSDANDGSSWDQAKLTVQAGIDTAATIGGEVWVQAGTYMERITLRNYAHIYGGFAGTEIQRSQRDWSGNVTVLDGNKSGSVVTAKGLYQGLSTIDGFVICNGGSSSGAGVSGGGVFCLAACPTIANNTITSNGGPDGSAYYGGGIYLMDSSPMITNNTISGNSAAQGGGIHCGTYGSTPIITNNTISGNNAGLGGGIHCGSGMPTITNNTISGNSAFANGLYDGRGGGIFCDSYRALQITGNRIFQNSAPYYGGGIYCSSPGTIANNSITANSATGSPYTTTSGIGGGIFCDSLASATIANNSIAGNRARSGGAGIECHQSSSVTIVNNTITGNSCSFENYSGYGVFCPSSTATIANNIVAFNEAGISATSTTPLRNNCTYGNTAGNYPNRSDPTGTNGNISVDPKLADAAYLNLHLQPDSPCINAGDDSVVQAGWVDMDGQARVLGGHVDIGADESDGTVWQGGPNVIVRVSPAGDDANDGSSWAKAKRTVQAGIDAVYTLGGDVWVAGGTYVERITLRHCAHVYGGFAGTEAARTERDWSAHVTILDGNQGGSVVTADRIGPDLSTVSGFTIRNGKAKNGGGIYCNIASPTIANNTITANTATQTGPYPTSSPGGGIYCFASSPTITDNTITGNSARDGSGIYLYLNSSAVIAGNTITGNSQTIGGTISCDHSSPTILGNIVSGNISLPVGYNNGIYCYYSSPSITGNFIAGNTTGIYCASSSSAIHANVIVGNNENGIECWSSSPTISSNTIACNRYIGVYSNSKPAAPTIIDTIVAFNGDGILGYDWTPVLQYNCVYGNTYYNYRNLTDPTGTNGNISVDPLLVRLPSPGADGKWATADDDYGDLHLLAGSPCINAGDPACVPASGETDLDGQPRKISTSVDIGADEFCLAGDANFDGYVNVGDLQVLVAAWGTQRGEAGYSPAVDFNGDGTVNVADLALLVGNWGKTIVDDYAQAGVRWLANNATQPGVVVTASGLQYKILTQGTGPVPTAVDTVTVNYAGSLINGNVFDNHNGAQFRVDQLIAGWVEALQLMPVGSRWMLYIPANLGYGNVPIGSIPPNSVLVFDVTLVSIP